MANGQFPQISNEITPQFKSNQRLGLVECQGLFTQKKILVHPKKESEKIHFFLIPKKSKKNPKKPKNLKKIQKIRKNLKNPNKQKNPKSF